MTHEELDDLSDDELFVRLTARDCNAKSAEALVHQRDMHSAKITILRILRYE